MVIILPKLSVAFIQMRTPCIYYTNDDPDHFDVSLPVPCSLRASSLVQMMLCSLVWL